MKSMVTPRKTAWATVLLTVGTLLAGLLVLLSGTKPAEAAFPGLNGKIAFYSSPALKADGSDTEIYVMNPNGSGKKRLTFNQVGDYDPSFSADGSKIVFASKMDGGSDIELWVMNADGTGATKLTNNTASDVDPAFSPDGTRIVFRSDRDGDGITQDSDPDNEIYVMKSDGTGAARRLTFNRASEGLPQWSPDGRKITWASRSVDADGDIHLMNSDGTNQRRLTTHTRGDFEPDFSPDGSRIVFFSFRDGDPEIYTMKAAPESATNRPVKLTNNTLADVDPFFSPDGKKIGFARGNERNLRTFEIYTMNTDGTGISKLTSNTAYDLGNSWQAR